MGQYWKVVNLDKREFLHPHALDDGLKLLEQAWSTGGVMTGLCMLLAPLPQKRGGGDPDAHEFLGRWAGDRIIYVGDYSVDGDAPQVPGFGSIYNDLDENWRDISKPVRQMIEQNR